MRQIRKLEDYDLLENVYILSQFGEKCIVHTDEYDGPIQKAIFESGSGFKKIIKFIRKNSRPFH